jgi:GntR family transcriptional regulator, arabinose operon transcriptional repressor
VASKNAQVMLAIEQDIRARGLKPGQVYQSAREVAQMLDVSPMTADRAMRKLATNGLLQRRHGSGTYVGEGVTNHTTYTARKIQIWVPSSFFAHYNVVVENIVKTVHLEFPGDSIEQVFIPDDNQLAFCERIAGSWDDGSRPRTLILVSCSQTVQQLVRDLEIPAVATGRMSKNTGEIPWIDMDYRQAGKLLSEFAVNCGHERILVLMNRLWGYGDNEFLEGIEQGFKSADKTDVDARVRSVELEQRAIEQHLRRALRGNNPPTAVICSSKITAQVAVRVAEGLGLCIPEDFLVCTVRVRAPQGVDCRYAYTRWAVSRETNTALYNMVQQLNQGKVPNPNNYLIPVDLVEPETLALWE